MILAYHAQLNSVDEQTQMTAAKAWAKWEYVSSSRCLSPPLPLPACLLIARDRMVTSRLYTHPDDVAKAENDKFAMQVCPA
jgi:hypothetical protein